MELNLKEVTITIIVGAYLLFGIEFLFYIIMKKSISLHLLHLLESRELSSRILVVLAVVSCFAFGMLTEALSDKLVDEDTVFQRQIIGRVPESKTDDEIKQHTLLGDKEIAAPLAMEFARRDLFSRYGGEHGEIIQKTLLCNEGRLEGLSNTHRNDAAKRLYYHAKNVVYEKNTYFDELQKIQLRIDFARSCAAVSTFLIGIGLPLFIITEGVRIVRYRYRKLWRFRLRKLLERRKKEVLKRIKRILRREDKTRRVRFYVTFVFLTLSFLASVYAYNAEEINFDKRAFGYFSSMNAAIKVGCKPQVTSETQQLIQPDRP